MRINRWWRLSARRACAGCVVCVQCGMFFLLACQARCLGYALISLFIGSRSRYQRPVIAIFHTASLYERSTPTAEKTRPQQQ